jgi:hypothetical protein
MKSSGPNINTGWQCADIFQTTYVVLQLMNLIVQAYIKQCQLQPPQNTKKGIPVSSFNIQIK